MFIAVALLFTMSASASTNATIPAEQIPIPMVDLRPLLESVQATLTYHVAANNLYIRRGETAVAVRIGAITARKNNAFFRLAAPVTLHPETNEPQISVYDIYPLLRSSSASPAIPAAAQVAQQTSGSGAPSAIRPVTQTGSAGAVNRTHVVQRGDTLTKIAGQYKTTVSALMQVNRLKSTHLSIGQRLQLSSGSPGVTTPSSPPASSTPTPTPTSTSTPTPTPTPTPTTPAIQAPDRFTDAWFPLLDNTYRPFTDTYGAVRSFNPDGNGNRSHEGNDIFAKTGIPLFSASDGKILTHGWSTLGGYRLSIRVNHENAAFYYAHLSSYAPGIANGATVKKGQLIGYVGSTGYGPEGTIDKFVPHLHFGIYDISNSKKWVAFNPFPYLKWWEARR